MISNKSNKNHNRNTKKKNNVKTKIRKYKKYKKTKIMKTMKTMKGGSGSLVTPQIEEYTFLSTLRSLNSRESPFTNHAYTSCAVSKDNRIYVVNRYKHHVQIFDGDTLNYIATLGITDLYGDSNKVFKYPYGVAVSDIDNRIYVSDMSNQRIQVFDGLTLKYIDTLGITDKTSSSNKKFNRPSGVAVSPVDNKIYVADTGNNRVQVFNYTKTLFGQKYKYVATLGITESAGSSNTQFSYPRGVAVSADNLIYVADTGNNRIQVFNGATRQYIATLGTGTKGSSNTQFNHPIGIAISPIDNRIYVADDTNNRVQIFDGANPNYKFIDTLGTTGQPGDSNTQFNSPGGVAVSLNNRIYVADTNNNRVQIFIQNVLPPDYNSPPQYRPGASGASVTSDPSLSYTHRVSNPLSNNSIVSPPPYVPSMRDNGVVLEALQNGPVTLPMYDVFNPANYQDQ